MATILELAEARAKAAQYVEGLRVMNVAGLTPEEQVASSARYRLAHDALMRAERDYGEAISALSTEELMALAATPAKETPG
jgi:hypothetical protein